MYLYLLEFIYRVKDRELVETWLSRENLGGVLISTRQYGDEILAVLANDQALVEARKQLRRHPAVSSCVEKWCLVYRIVATTTLELVISSFPLRGGEEWYLGTEKMAYLCTQWHQLSTEQMSWLLTSPTIVSWEDQFDLTPIPIGIREA
jgi:hypothetical protein